MAAAELRSSSGPDEGSQLGDSQLVVASSAVLRQSEAVEARTAILIGAGGDLLAALMERRCGIVAGAHGKTTTAAMIGAFCCTRLDLTLLGDMF